MEGWATEGCQAHKDNQSNGTVIIDRSVKRGGEWGGREEGRERGGVEDRESRGQGSGGGGGYTGVKSGEMGWTGIEGEGRGGRRRVGST